MTADIVLLSLLAVLTLLGWYSGALRQALRVAAVAAVFGLSPLVSGVVREALFANSGMSPVGVELASMTVAGLAIYLAVVLTGTLTIRAMRRASSTLSGLDRAAGAVVGFAKGALIVYLAAVSLVLLEVPLERRDPHNGMGLRGGHLARLAGKHNVMAPWQFPDLGRLHAAARLAHVREAHKEHARALAAIPLVREVLDHAGLQPILQDTALAQAARENRYPVTLSDARIRRLLKDEGFVAMLRAVQWDDLERQFPSPASQKDDAAKQALPAS